MKAQYAVLVALATAVTLTPVAAAGPAAPKQRVAITSNLHPQGAFVLTPLQAGALERDSGRVTIVPGDSRVVMREGQKVEVFARSTYTFEGRLGSLTIRERTEWVEVSNNNAPGYGYPPGVAIGTWKVVRGTGQYARVAGGGRSGHLGFGSPWLARQDGFLSVP